MDDEVLDADAGCGQPEGDGQVGKDVRVVLDGYLLATADDEPALRGGSAEVEVAPPQRRRHREPECGHDQGVDLPVRLVQSGDDRGDGLAEHEDDEEPESLRQVLQVQRDVAGEPGGDEGPGDVDEHTERPEHVPCWLRQQQGDPPQQGAGARRGEVDADVRPGLGYVPIGSEVEQEEQDPQPDVARRERRRVLAHRTGGTGRQPGGGEGAGQLRQPVDHVVGVEAVGVDRGGHPRPPHHGEEPGEDKSPMPGRVLVVRAGDLRHGQDVRQVEEELQAGRRALLTRAQPGWLDQRSGARFGRAGRVGHRAALFCRLPLRACGGRW